MLVYVFPGQGSQEKGMGRDLFEEFPRETTRASEILGYSIKNLCLNDPNDRLGLTDSTQSVM